ncbi:MAG: AAA family ATPase [Candidatus Vogelbacteria bacterium]|nr:AAA family ATPase [Candidatus Vogelbacteria bacterium]
MLNKLVIHNYRVFHGTFVADFNDDINIIVGNNESGKSTILEAINLVLTRRIYGRTLNDRDLSPYLFNREVVEEYVAALKNGKKPPPPLAFLEAYLSDACELEILRGSNNSLKQNAIGVRLEITLNQDFAAEYEQLLADNDWNNVLPTEFYTVTWRSFADAPVSYKGLGVGVSFIDTTTIRLQTGTDSYIRDILDEHLHAKDRAALSLAYRRLKEQFSKEDSIVSINEVLNKKGGGAPLSQKPLSISIDISQKANWETHLTPHLDELPFQFVGKGEQSMLKIMLALEMNAHKSNIILIEEPENHLSHGTMRTLINRMSERCVGKQMILATHSAYVLNKLGLSSLLLLANQRVIRLTSLSEATKEYFMKLSGYDTLRLILAERAILVEGPSDELIVQKAFFLKHGAMPIDKGVDVINVRGLSFKRFLDIAIALGKTISVVTDNDGNYDANITRKYKDYSNNPNVSIFASEDNSLPTLEPQLVRSIGLATMNTIIGTDFASEDDLIIYMTKSENKTDSALKLFETDHQLKFPKYIQDVVE